MKKLLYILFTLFFISSYAQRGGRTSVIKKDRWVDYCLAKGNDTRTYIDDTDPENPVTIYPIFRFRQANIDGISNPSGILDIRSSIKQSDTVLNTRVQRFNGAITDYIGDTKQRNAYPAGMLELHIRIPRWQRNMLQALNFRYGFFRNGNNAQYLISELDIEPLGNVLGVKTVDDTNINGRLTNLNLKNNKDLKRIEIYAISESTLDISDNENLEFLKVGTSFGAVDTLLLANEYPLLTYFNIGNNNLTDISGLNAPNLTSLHVYNNTTLGNIDISVFPNLVNFSAYNTGMTALDVSGNTGLRTLDLGSITNNNNLSNGIVGLDLLSDLRTLNLGFSNYVGDIDLSDYPLLTSLDIQRCSSVSFDVADIDFTPNLKNLIVGRTSVFGVLNGNVNSNLLEIKIGGTTISYFNSAKYPNVRSINKDNSGNSPMVFDLQYLTRVDYFLTYQNGTTGILDFSGVTTANMGSAYFRVHSCPNITKIILPSVQVHNRVFSDASPNFGIYNLNGLTELVGLNAIVRNNTALYIPNLSLSVLDTSFGTGTCLPNVTNLALGGVNDTYTSTAVYDVRKNNLTALFVLGNHFQVNGSLGTDTCASAHTIHVEGDSDLSYTTSATFAPIMRRVFLRPNATSGLALDGDQVANLIIDLSTKEWIQGTGTNASINVKGTVYPYRIIDLRGNCAAPTPSTELTNAINILTSKNVTVLTN